MLHSECIRGFRVCRDQHHVASKIDLQFGNLMLKPCATHQLCCLLNPFTLCCLDTWNNIICIYYFIVKKSFYGKLGSGVKQIIEFTCYASSNNWNKFLFWSLFLLVRSAAYSYHTFWGTQFTQLTHAQAFLDSWACRLWSWNLARYGCRFQSSSKLNFTSALSPLLIASSSSLVTRKQPHCGPIIFSVLKFIYV